MGTFLRFLLIFGAIWLVLSLLRKSLENRPGPDARKPAPPRLPATMRRCAHCGIYIPDEESVNRDGEYFCSPDHARRGAT